MSRHPNHIRISLTVASFRTWRGWATSYCPGLDKKNLIEQYSQELFNIKYNPKTPSKIFTIHIPKNGLNKFLSANFSPPINPIQ